MKFMYPVESCLYSSSEVLLYLNWLFLFQDEVWPISMLEILTVLPEEVGLLSR